MKREKEKEKEKERKEKKNKRNKPSYVNRISTLLYSTFKRAPVVFYRATPC